MPGQPQRKRYVGGVLIALAGVAIGGYVMVASHDEGKPAAAHAAPPVRPNRPADLFARIDQMLTNLPREANDVACTDSEAALPLVAYASAEARLDKRPPMAGEATLLSGAIPLAEINQRLASAHRIAILRTLELTHPQPSVGIAKAGRYEGQLVVVDTNTGVPLCHTRVVAWSSSIIDQAGLGEHTLREDFNSRVRAALAEGSARLHIELDR
jgi:hypothetical protein